MLALIRTSAGPFGFTADSALARAVAAAIVAGVGALGCTGAIGPGVPVQTSVRTPAGGAIDSGRPLKAVDDGPSAGAGGAVGQGPRVVEVRIPWQASATFPIWLSLAGVADGALQIHVEVSRDGRDAFRPATFGDAGTADAGSGWIAAAGRAPVTVKWRSLADVGFRAGDQAQLRFTVRQGGVTGAPTRFQVTNLDNLRAASRLVDRYVINYGDWSAEDRAVARRSQLVIGAPGDGGMTRADIADIGGGQDPDDPADDVIVLCYLSAGEDLRTARLGVDELRADPRFRGDGSGPRIDPRGPGHDGGSLDNLDPLGLPSNGGAGFASYYLDDNSVHASPLGIGDGIPDRNSVFGALFVNAGDPRWFDLVDGMTVDGPDGLPGLRELLSRDYGRGFGCDGVFLDTIDTASPNSFTDSSAPNPSKFEWTAPGLSSFVSRVTTSYPGRLVALNRGLFYFDPDHPAYRHSPRGFVDFVLFESYRLSSNAAGPVDAQFFADNRFHVTPRLMAEANRADGFRVLSLGYAVGPSQEMSADTLIGRSMIGYDSLMEDIHVTQDLAGFRHYLSTPSLTPVNDFVARYASWDDNEAPTWTSTFDDRSGSGMQPATPRVGIQRATAVPTGKVTVAWDSALDKNRVHYLLYWQRRPFDFAADPGLTQASHTLLVPRVPADYAAAGTGPGRYPNEASIDGFARGVTWYLLIRAEDDSPAHHQDRNTVVLTATP
jgi:hypothetical protein